VAALITDLIDKLDTFEMIRDQVAAILAVESVEQVRLAEAANKARPEDWEMRVFVERSDPWDVFVSGEDESTVDATPIVNVWFDNSTVDLSKSDLIERQNHNGVVNIDCYGYGLAKQEASGHLSSDEAAAMEAQRAVRLARNILMAGHYTYLGFPRGANQLVANRYPQSITMFQPQLDNRTIQNVQAARLALLVNYNEYSPQVQGQPLELISTQVLRSVTGQVLLAADFDH